ncbi:hypothetical protein GCM10009132_43390 [Serratia ureilytica]
MSIELRPHVSGDRQNDMFFQRTGVANGAGVDAAMAGIQHDQESFPRTLRARLFFGAWQAVGASQRRNGAIERQSRQPGQHHSAAGQARVQKVLLSHKVNPHKGKVVVL